MIAACRAEWVVCRRPRFAGVAVGLAAGATALATLAAFRVAGLSGRAAARRGAGRAQAVLERLAEHDGWLEGFRNSGRLLGVIALVIVALRVGDELRFGTWRPALLVEPSRTRLLAGKLAALYGLAMIAALASLAAGLLLALLLAGGASVDTSAWSPDAGVVFDTAVATAGWVTAGALLALLLGSSGAAVGVGLGYGLVGEPILGLLLDNGFGLDVARWLPGRALTELVNPTTLPHLAVVFTALTYVAVFATAGFARLGWGDAPA